MYSTAPLLLHLFNGLIIALAMLLGVLFFKREQDLAVHRFNGPFKLIYLGVTLSSLSFLADSLHSAGLLYLPEPVVYGRIYFWLHMGYVSGSVITFLGLAIFINRVIPLSSRQVLRLAAAREQLTASNDELARTIATRNKELEINNHTLQRVLEEQQDSRRALTESEQKFRTFFDESPAVFVSLGRDHRIKEINRYGAAALGYGPKELIGETFETIVSPEDYSTQEHYLEDGFTSAQGTSEIELRLLRNDTQSLWTKVSASLVNSPEREDTLLLVCQDISESKELAESLYYQARHDDLTGLFNRRALENFIAEKLEIMSPVGKPLALIFMDIDQLKVVNDTCGHRAGDEYIRQLVQRIGEHHGQFDFFARAGGDELAMVLIDTSPTEAVEMAELARNIAEDFSFSWQDQSFRQSLSVGVALTSRNIRSLSDIMAAADAACYTAKQQGRNRVVVQEDTPELLDANRSEMLWVSRLQTALMRDRFELYFQPICDLRHRHSGYIHYEVLIRYVDDDGTHRTPDNFLPAAERFGLTNQIDLWVLTTTLDYLDRHPAHTRALNCCSINLSAHSLASHQSRSAIKQLVMTAQFPKNKLCFEITETNAIHNLQEAVEFVNDLKILGCRFALDDFGTGFSSFSYLQNLAVDYIKIDGSFIRDIINNEVGRAMVKAMNAIGRELNIGTIAEYVESDEIIAELIHMDVAYGQGFALAKPMPVSMMEEYYRENITAPLSP
ncbi:putative bifunctional diguanylate cyclase/phosphodiesterase [Teredinibacter turnerae]|uniref:putative bifunctional diguanylate cyclase/phosphodiesterase n=1 Tax=Teredinibacter turnerae TaxID=2426 RepID=UPI00037F2F9A|nr:EAL domain-containing protein [Teredinibacter turnerae]